MPKDPVCLMKVDSKNSFNLKQNGEIFYFCSRHCLEEFLRRNKISSEEAGKCLTESSGGKWYGNKTLIVAGILFFLSLISYVFPFFEPFRKSLLMYFNRIWWAVSAGLILGGVIDRFIPREYISHVLGKRGRRAVFYSVILGFFMSACSHGILALSIELHKKGASNSSVVAFLLSSPWANFPLTILLVGFFGLKAMYIIFCALIIALITGFIYQWLEEKNLIEINTNKKETSEEFSVLKDFKDRVKDYKFTLSQVGSDIKGVFEGAAALADMVLWWIFIGMGIASLVAAYVPQGIFQNYLGPTALGLLTTLVIATVMEVCSEGTAPLAFEIYRQTLAFGNAFVFLMAGVVTDYTEIGLLWHNVGKRTAFFLPLITVPQVIVFGLLANAIW